jgi:Na+/melibiose symporter-like transporter
VVSLFVLLARDVWGLGRLASPLILAYLIAGVIFLPLLLRVLRGRRKSRAAAALALALVAALPFLLAVRPGNAVAAFAVVALLGAPSVINATFFDSLMADIAAQAERRGHVQTGGFFALHMLAGRLGRAASLAAAFWVLDRIGFRPGGTNTAAALAGFKAVYVGAPIALQSAIAVLAWRFPEAGYTPEVVRQKAFSTGK